MRILIGNLSFSAKLRSLLTKEMIVLYERANTRLGSLHEFCVIELKRLSELLGINKNNLSTIIKRATAIALKATDPTLKNIRNSKPRNTETNRPAVHKKHVDDGVFSVTAQPADDNTRDARTQPIDMRVNADEVADNVKPQQQATRPPSRYISAFIKKIVWQRDNSQCTFTDPISKRRCASRFALQVDHVIPCSCDGTADVENLRLLCPNHNRLMAKRIFGINKMEQYK